MAIVPAQKSTVTPVPPAVYIERMSRADACDSCLSNYEVPRGTMAGPEGGFIALYKCHVCQHVWHTGWEDA